jgi:carboxylesterase
MRSWYQDAIHLPFSLRHDEGPQTGALLVHGFTGSPADMRTLADTVFACGIDVHAMVLPGMAGEIDQLNNMTSGIWRDAVRRQWRELSAKYERTVLIGYSLGGALSMLAAVDHPPDLLVLIAPLSRLADRRAMFLPLVKYVMRGVRPYVGLNWDDPRVHEWFDRTRPSMQTRDPVNQAVLTQDALYSARMLDQLRRLLRQARRMAPSVTASTLIVQGVDDRVVLPRDTRRLVARIGGPVIYREIQGDHYLPLPAFQGWSHLQQVMDSELRTWLNAVRKRDVHVAR